MAVGGIDFDIEDAKAELETSEKPNTGGNTGGKYMMLRLSDQTIELRTYGVDIEQVDQFASIISKLLSWARSRSQLLQQVLHQKMGLYAHSTTALSTNTTMVVEGGGRHSGVGSNRPNR